MENNLISYSVVSRFYGISKLNFQNPHEGSNFLKSWMSFHTISNQKYFSIDKSNLNLVF